MTGTNSKETIVKGDEETREFEYEIWEWKVEGKGDGKQEEEVERLCRLLKSRPSRLVYEETEEVIRNFDVGDIIGWASKSREVKEKANEGYLYLDQEAGSFVPSPEKVDRLMRLMLLRGVEKLKAVDMYILYSNFTKGRFVSMLLHALDSYSKRHLDDGQSVYPKEMRVDIGKAGSVLPWTLFAHVMYKLTLLPVFKCTASTITRTSEEEEEEYQKKAAENCDICNGKGKHSGVYGYYCSYWQSVPCGVTVGPMHVVFCSKCHAVSRSPRGDTCVRCSCGSKEGKAVPCDYVSWDPII